MRVLINLINMKTNDTIAAQATPTGRGGVGIIRVSGPQAAHIAQQLLGAVPAPRVAEYRRFHATNGEVIDMGLALYFPAPHSFTGEDVLELQGHGGPVVMDLLLQAVITQGARLARPGEFSERAYLNDKLDLAQAEAVADLIDAGSAQAARAALRSLQGEFSQQIHHLVEAVTRLRVYVEAAIDFADEEIDFLQEGQVNQTISGLQAELVAIQRKAHQGRVLKEGIHVVLAGQPNAGKSSLLNALAGHDAAIVTPIPGTTRDVLREEISLDGMPLHVIDTAGLRESSDLVEQEGIRRTWLAIEKSDCVLFLVDATHGWQDQDKQLLEKLPVKLPVIVVLNKIDLVDLPGGVVEQTPRTTIRISATSGAGLAELIEILKQQVGYQASNTGVFSARRRHLIALEEAATALQRAEQVARDGQGELIAEELRQVQQALGQITGEVSSDDLLGRIFASFCIGK